MSQRDDTHQQDRRVEKKTSRANELLRSLERAPSILRDLLQEMQSLRNQLEVVEEQLRTTEEKLAMSDEARQRVEEQLRTTEEKLAMSDEARQRAEDHGRDWQRRANEVKVQLAESRDNAVREALNKLREARVLYYLDVLDKRASPDGEASTQQEESSNRPSLRTLASAIEKWVNEISGSKLSRVFEDAEVTVDRGHIAGLVEFQPSNPFSDEFPRARCRVLSSGWLSGDFIIEKAVLEPIEVLSVSPSTDDTSDWTLEGDSETPNEQLSTMTSAEPINNEGISTEPDDRYPDQSALQPDSSHLEELKRATAMLEKKLTSHQKELWDKFIQAAASEKALEPEVREELAKWTRGKKSPYRTIVSVLNEGHAQDLAKLIEGVWSNLVGPREANDEDK